MQRSQFLKLLELNEKTRFILIGLVNTAFGYTAFTVLHVLFSPNLASLQILFFAYCAAAFFNYFSLGLFVFGLPHQRIKSFFKSVISLIFLFFLNSFLLQFLLENTNFHILFAQFLITGLVVAASYILHKWFSFRD